MRGWNVELLNVKPGGTYSNHWSHEQSTSHAEVIQLLWVIVI